MSYLTSRGHNFIVVSMIPSFDPTTGTLPPGDHNATWDEVVARYGITPHRLTLLAGLKAALDALRAGGCQRAYIDGSFAVTKLPSM